MENDKKLEGGLISASELSALESELQVSIPKAVAQQLMALGLVGLTHSLPNRPSCEWSGSLSPS
jgi:hypothetical protein